MEFALWAPAPSREARLRRPLDSPPSLATLFFELKRRKKPPFLPSRAGDAAGAAEGGLAAGGVAGSVEFAAPFASSFSSSSAASSRDRRAASRAASLGVDEEAAGLCSGAATAER